MTSFVAMGCRNLTDEEIKYIAENCIKNDHILYLTDIPERWEFFEEIRGICYYSEEPSNEKFEAVCKENFLVFNNAIAEIEKITGNKILFIIDSESKTTFYFDGWKKYLAELACDGVEFNIEVGVATFTFAPYSTHFLTDVIAKVYQHQIKTGKKIHKIHFFYDFEIIV